jgi:GNAT superfamily N-acetyltransferase
MPHYRSFSNTDPPALVHLWQSIAAESQHFSPISLELLEKHVLSKPYFDHSGMQLAFDDRHQLIGFAHAGFGPNEKKTDISTENGVICLILISPECSKPEEIGAGLMGRCESYLVERGAKRIFGGAVRPCAPFYLGLYGGSEPLGVFESDHVATDLFSHGGYERIHNTLRYQLNLAGYRPPMNRRLLQWRRQVSLDYDDSPRSSHWWEACMMCDFHWLRATAKKVGDDRPIASGKVRLMDCTEDGCMIPSTAGLMDIRVAKEYRRQGLATFILREMFLALDKMDVSTVEAQANENDGPLRKLLESLSMKVVENGAVFRKEVD